MAYDPVTRRLIMFGGLRRRRRCLNDTWAYDPAANTWTELEPAGTLPSARSGHSMAYDPASRRLIMFGGRGDADARLERHLGLRPAANTWTELDPAGHAALGPRSSLDGLRSGHPPV